jgi:cell wall-associated NlpC family hydrolase
MWSDEWVGIPYVRGGRTRAGADCLGLFILLHAERHGRLIHDPACGTIEAVTLRVAEAERAQYDEVTGPVQEGDAILLRLSGHPIHVGYCVDETFMIHAFDDAGSQLERWNGSKWAKRVIGIFRHRD